MSDWLVEFKGRNYSGVYNQNFLWQDNNIYIMDNHRAALWCWMQYIELDNKYDLFHIDRHYDMLQSRLSEWDDILPDIKKMTLDEYLNISQRIDLIREKEIEIIRWDNYLSIFFYRYSEIVNHSYFITHNDRDKPKFKDFNERYIWDIPKNFDYWLSIPNYSWIINIDIDFYFCSRNDDDIFQMISDEYIKEFSKALKLNLEKGKIQVLTIALSPEYCGGWENSERVLNIMCNELGIQFALPQ